MNFIARCTLIGSVCWTFGCEESVESTDIRTSGIYPEITVTADGDGSFLVSVRLKVGGRSSNTFMDLKGEDELTATVGDDTKVLDETDDETYTASFATAEEGTEFLIAFDRGSLDDSAPASTVTLPAPFELSVSPVEASRATDAIDVTWEPPATGNVNWEIEGECIIRDDANTPDDGAHVLAAGTIETFMSDADKACTVDLTLTRSRSGSIDPAFTEGGNIVARQVRRKSFTSNP